jgi:MarR family transcriptional regulator, transcriptional regulator for hemolysin
MRLQEICSSYEVTAVQWLVLYHIYENEGCTSMDIVKEWSVEKPTVSSFVRKLSDQGLLQSRSGDDKRQKFLYLTAAGEILCEKIMEKVAELQSFVTEPFLDEAVDEITQQIVILEERMKKPLQGK